MYQTENEWNILPLRMYTILNLDGLSWRLFRLYNHYVWYAMKESVLWLSYWWLSFVHNIFILKWFHQRCYKVLTVLTRPLFSVFFVVSLFRLSLRPYFIVWTFTLLLRCRTITSLDCANLPSLYPLTIYVVWEEMQSWGLRNALIYIATELNIVLFQPEKSLNCQRMSRC